MKQLRCFGQKKSTMLLLTAILSMLPLQSGSTSSLLPLSSASKTVAMTNPYKEFLDDFSYPQETDIRFVDHHGNHHHLTVIKSGLVYNGSTYKLSTSLFGGTDLNILSIQATDDGREIKVETDTWIPIKKNQLVNYDQLEDLIGYLQEGVSVIGEGEKVRFERQ